MNGNKINCVLKFTFVCHVILVAVCDVFVQSPDTLWTTSFDRGNSDWGNRFNEPPMEDKVSLREHLYPK